MKPDEAPPKSVMVGILRIARGRADGLLCFGATPQSFLARLAPLVAFPLVGAVLTLASRGAREALTGFAMTLCALLVPAVLSFEIARAWGRADRPASARRASGTVSVMPTLSRMRVWIKASHVMPDTASSTAPATTNIRLQ